MIGEETVETPRRGKTKSAGVKTGGGGGTWDPIPTKEVDETFLCGAANGNRVRLKIMFALVGGPPPLRASDGLATCWAYHSQGGIVQTATASGTTIPPCRRTWDLGKNTQGGFGLNYDERGPRRDRIIK